MQLNENGLKDREKWESTGYRLPGFDRIKVAEETKKDPFWIHFGAGNIFRAFQANVVQELLDSGDLDRGLIAAEGYDYEIIEKMNHPHDDLSILVTLKDLNPCSFWHIPRTGISICVTYRSCRSQRQYKTEPCR